MRFASAGRTLARSAFARVLAAPPPLGASKRSALRPPLRATTPLLQRRAAHAAAAGMDATEQYLFDLNGYIVVPQARRTPTRMVRPPKTDAGL